MRPRLSLIAVLLLCLCISSVILKTTRASASTPTAAHDNTVELAGLFSDQGPMFDSVLEPTCSTAVTASVRSYHNDLTAANIVYYDSATSTSTTVAMSLTGQDATGVYDTWQGTIPASCSEKYYRFELIDGSATAWYNAGGATTSEPSIDDFYIIPGFTVPAWARSGVMYQIFPDRFYNGNTSNDVTTNEYSYQGNSTIQENWGASPIVGSGGSNNLVFYGGDLQGIDQKMNYLKNTLGINALYLTPIFTSPSNHKYDSQDYFNVDPHLGGNSALTQLVSDMHSTSNGSQGYVVLDGVFDHTGVWSTWFNQGDVNANDNGAEQSQSSPYYPYYDFQSWPNTYTDFLGYSTLPKLDYGSSGSAVRNSIYNSTSSVAQSWIRNYGIDGWRLDAATYLDSGGNNGSDATNHQIWQEFRSAVKGADPNAFLFGEDWGNAAAWTNTLPSQWDAAMNYAGFTDPISEWITGEDYNGSSATLTPSAFDAALLAARETYPTDVQQAMSNFLSSQDITRFGQRANGNASEEALAAIFQMTYEGLPTIYYGDEYGMQGGADPDDRRTFDWTQATTGNSLVALYQKLIGIRKTYSALTDGSFLTMLTDNTNNVYAYGRMDQKNNLAVVLNNDTNAHTITVPAYEVGMANGNTVTDLLSGTTYQVSAGNVTLTLQGHSGAILLNGSSAATPTPTPTTTPTSTPTPTPAATPTPTPTAGGTTCTVSTVSSTTCPLVAGQSATISYTGTLASSATSLTMHWGYNNWSGITDTVMTKQSNGAWTASIVVPSGATVINTAFYNQSSTWDSNGSSNYNLPVGSCYFDGVTATPCPQVAGQSTTITYSGTLAASATSLTLHWGYNNWSGITNAAMTKQSSGAWTATIIIPSAATTLNLAFYNQSSTWDSNGSSNYNFNV